MFRSRSWFGGGWGRPKNPHSLEHLKYLYNVLARNQTVSEHNRGLLVESLRCIAEILIWGDQNDSSVFDFFLEKNMLSFFLRIMRQRSGGSSYVCVQLLQTLNILFENIRNETSLYYLLSNNHVNSIIVHKFDFSDEEVMAYYISFLKTLSLKLNAHTIHFFYNEHTNDFPLYTEAIKFFNHPESMVRIAVRTLTLNVYRVDDASMLAFIRDRTAAPYFSNIVWFIGKHILELDACVRNDADHQSHNRLADLVAEHLDHLHYINDILCLNIIDLNRVLTEHLLHKLFIPLYIYSLTGSRNKDVADVDGDGDVDVDAPPNTSFSSSAFDEQSDTATTNGRVSSVVALFLLSQVFLIITHAPLVRTLAWIILKADKSIFQKDYKDLVEKCIESHDETETKVLPSPSFNNIQNVKKNDDDDDDEKEECSNCVPIKGQKNATDEEKLLVTTPAENICTSPFFEAVMKALDCSENDYTALFSLSLLYALGNNKGIPNELLRRVLRPEYVESTDDLKYNSTLIEKIVQIVNMSCQPTCRVRLVTLELSLKLMLQLVSSDQYKRSGGGRGVLTEGHKAAMETARAQSTALVRNFYKSEEIFLDMFEHEYDLFQLRYCDMSKGPLNVEWLCMDSAILLPPTGTPMTGISFTKRLPCGEVERARRAIRVYFLVRDTFLSLTGEPETQLPLTNPQSCVQVDTVLDLNNSDLISCVVVWKDGQKIRRFLVIDVLQLILVEPDTKKLGWGVVKLVGFLQDIEVVGDKDDSRCLHITIHRPLSASNVNRVPLLSAKFIFDDHIRCMAAKQRLTKGRIKARQKKMQHIARLLDIPGQTGPASPAYVGSGIYNTRITGRGNNRENRPLFCTGRVPGFATPRRDSAPATSDIASTSSRRTRDSDSPARLLEKKMDKTNGSGSAKSRDNSSGRNNRSRDGSPRMPRPRSEEIPLELIKRTQSSVEASPKISILPRPQQVQQSDDVAVTSADEETATTSISTVQANEQLNSEETSFIAQQDKRMPRRKGAIETV